MSLRSTFEHVLHIDSFRNIDLFQQGLYYMRFYLTMERDGRIDYSQPYNYIEGNKQQPQQQNQRQRYQGVQYRDNHTWAAAQILDNLSAFQSKTFMIRYQEEEVQINEICFFKIDVSAYPLYNNYEFTLYCELMCADIQRIGGPPSDDDNSDQLFKCISVYQSRIRNSHNGIHAFTPVMFGNQNFCVINCTFHGSLQKFNFALSEQQIQFSRQNKQQNLLNANQPIMIQPKSFLEFLNKVTKRFNRSECQNFFENYVGYLKQQCQTMTEFLIKFQNTIKLQSKCQINIPDYTYFDVLEKENIVNQLSDTQFQKKKETPITQFLDLKKPIDQQRLAQFIEKDFNLFTSILFQLNNQLVKLLLEFPKQMIQYLQVDYITKVRDKWGETYFRDTVKTEQFYVKQKKQSQSSYYHQQISQELRKKLALQSESNFDVDDLDLFPRYQLRPVIFEEVCQRQTSTFFTIFRQGFNLSEQPTHIIVLAHGFQGNSYDLRLVKDNLSLLYPQALFLCSRSNEEQTDGNIGDMGVNLAQEVINFINEWANNKTFKLSFIGHSMGGIIIRSALPHLSKYKEFMYTYISLSSPHLGYMYNSSSIIDAGLWLLKRMRKSLSLQQLSMTDDQNIEDTYLYKLAKQKGLNWFQNLVFIGSIQDNYVPYESARVDFCEEANQDNTIKAKRYNQMIEQLLSSLRAEQVIRIDVNFVLDSNTIDNMIGRTAHLQFLENDAFLKSLVCCQPHLFQ